VLKTLVENAGLREEFREKTKNRADFYFRADRVVEQLKEIYLELL
jgi:hypothetical protein